MYSTILVPLDGSRGAEAILPHVEQLAHRFDASVVFLQVIETIGLSVGSDGAYLTLGPEEFKRRANRTETYLAALQDAFGEKGFDARTIIDCGPVLDAIMDAAKTEGTDLIALASHGRTGLSRVYYGSVAAGLLHRADCPLLLVRSWDGE
jgi:nucleotide-binding universal stress UspA family protein